MRRLMYDALSKDTGLRGLGLPDTGTYSGDVDTPNERPFLDLIWGDTPEVPNIGGTGPRFLSIWVHDQPNDYDRIDSMIRRIKVVLAGLVGVKHEAGYLIVAEWAGDSGDGRDEGHGTIFRQTNWRLIGSGA